MSQAFLRPHPSAELFKGAQSQEDKTRGSDGDGGRTRVEDGEDGRRDDKDFMRTETVVVVGTASTDGGGAGRVKQVELMGPGTWFSAAQEPFLPSLQELWTSL